MERFSILNPINIHLGLLKNEGILSLIERD